jgi:hypothetical protein
VDVAEITARYEELTKTALPDRWKWIELERILHTPPCDMWRPLAAQEEGEYDQQARLWEWGLAKFVVYIRAGAGVPDNVVGFPTVTEAFAYWELTKGNNP